MLNAAPTRRHLARLIEAGWKQQTIAKTAGVGVATVAALRTGEAKTVSVRVAVALHALKPIDANCGHFVPAIGTLRRILALQSLGYPMREIARRAGLTPRYGNQLIYTGQRWVHADAARRVREVYDELSMTVAPDTRAARHVKVIARRNGGVPPLAWDDIDDPNEEPSGVAFCEKADCYRAPVAQALCMTHYKQQHTGGQGAHVDVDDVVVRRILDGEWKLKANPTERTEVCRRYVAAGGSTLLLSRLTGWKVERYFKVGEVAA